MCSCCNGVFCLNWKALNNWKATRLPSGRKVPPTLQYHAKNQGTFGASLYHTFATAQGFGPFICCSVGTGASSASNSSSHHRAAPICVHQVQTSGQVSNRNEKWQTSSSDLQHLKGLISVGMVTCFALPNSLRIPHEKLKVLFLWLKLSHFNKMSCCSWFAD